MKKIIDKNTIIEMFQKKKIRTFYDVPEEFTNDKEIIALQRQLGHRISNLRGYDVINNEFFVEESIAWDKRGRSYDYEDRKITFSTFEDYYDFLNGDIYENAYYYQYVFTSESIDKYKINLEKIKFSKEIESTFENLESDIKERKQKYRETKKKLKQRKVWIEKFNGATTYDDFMLVVHNYQKKHSYFNIGFYIWNYITRY